MSETETEHEDIWERILELNGKQGELRKFTRRENEDVWKMLLDLNGKLKILQDRVEKLEREP